MSRSTKIWLLIAGILTVCGLVMTAGALAIGPKDLSRFEFGTPETETHQITDAFRDIRIETDMSDVAIELSEDGACRVVCVEEKDRKHTVSVEEGVLSIEGTDKREWWKPFSWYWTEHPRITVYLPQTEYDSLFIGSTTSDINVAEALTFLTGEITLSTGTVGIQASFTEQLRVQTTTGAIYLSKGKLGSLEAEVTTGSMTVRNVEIVGAARLDVTTGRVSLTDASLLSLASTGTTGEVALNRVIVSEGLTINRTTGDVRLDDSYADTITVTTDTGDVRLENSDGGTITVTTDTGDIRGTLLTAKIIFAESDTGKVVVPRMETGGRCELTTDTGDILIEIP